MPDTDAPDRPLLVLIAGPYLSGTDGDPTKIAANRARLEAAALPIYERGHLPLLGEWLALLRARRRQQMAQHMAQH